MLLPESTNFICWSHADEDLGVMLRYQISFTNRALGWFYNDKDYKLFKKEKKNEQKYTCLHQSKIKKPILQVLI